MLFLFVEDADRSSGLVHSILFETGPNFKVNYLVVHVDMVKLILTSLDLEDPWIALKPATKVKEDEGLSCKKVLKIQKYAFMVILELSLEEDGIQPLMP